jgi:tRNA (guanine-N7-)-methyltransferase
MMAELRRVRSFVRRDGRMTSAQEYAFTHYMEKFGLKNEMVDFASIFQRTASRTLEIGFGSGTSLFAMAKAAPEIDFIGIEIHKPGIGQLLQNIEAAGLTNLRIFYKDAVEVLRECIPDHSLDTIQIFFPDPWQKRRHHKRRLIQPEFIHLLSTKIKIGGTLHLATDWEDYAVHMMRVLTDAPQFKNAFGHEQYADRSSGRPVVTKFEKRGAKEGRPIWELRFIHSLS